MLPYPVVLKILTTCAPAAHAATRSAPDAVWPTVRPERSGSSGLVQSSRIFPPRSPALRRASSAAGHGTVSATTSARVTASLTFVARALPPVSASNSSSLRSAASRTPKTTSCPPFAQATPSVPPTFPAPMIAILIDMALVPPSQDRAPVFDQRELISLHVPGQVSRLRKAGALVEPTAIPVVALDLDRQLFHALASEFREPGVEQLPADPSALPIRQYIDSCELCRVRRSPHELGEPDDLALRFGDEEARSRRPERPTQALGRVPAAKEPALNVIRNDASIGHRPRGPGDALHARDIGHLGSPYQHLDLLHLHTPVATRPSAPGDDGPAAGSPHIPADPS